MVANPFLRVKKCSSRLAILLRNGTLPEVWIPPSELRDQRELLRLRIFLVRLRTRVKNHNVQVPGADLFGVAARLELGKRLPELPVHSREAVEQELATLDFLEMQIESAEQRLEAIMQVSAEADLLKTLPCVGLILSMVLMLEIGRVDRFPTAAHLASYAGLVPRVHSSGGHTRMGQVCGNVNRNLKWAFVETGNLIVINQRRFAGTHVVRLYRRIKTCQESPKGGGRSGAPLGRSRLVDTYQAGGLSRTVRSAATGSFVDARVSASNCLAPRG